MLFKITVSILLVLLLAWNIILTIDAEKQDDYNKTNNEVHQTTLRILENLSLELSQSSYQDVNHIYKDGINVTRLPNTNTFKVTLE